MGDFRLKLGELEKKIVHAVLIKKKELDESDSGISYLCSSYRISEKREINEFLNLFNSAQVVSSFECRGGIFSGVYDIIKPICEYIHDTTLAVIFTPIENQLKAANFESEGNIDINGKDLPDYSFAPQEFITVVGQVRENQKSKSIRIKDVYFFPQMLNTFLGFIQMYLEYKNVYQSIIS